MKLKIGTEEFAVNMVEDRKDVITVRTAADADVTALKTAVEGASEITYTDDEDALVYKLYGAYRLKFVGGEDDGLKFTFTKADTVEARVAQLESQNASLLAEKTALEEELTGVQLALAELTETLLSEGGVEE